MHFIKEIIQGNPEKDHIHRRFIRYGKGEFCGPTIRIKNKGDTLKISASNEYVNALGSILAKDTDSKLNISGNIISTEDIKDYLTEKNISIKKSTKKKKTYTLQVKGSTTAEYLSKIYSELPDSHILLDLKPDEGNENLKTKKKIPNPGTAPDQGFCSATLKNSKQKAIIEEFCFGTDTHNFKEINISHTYLIKEIIIPEEYRKDHTMARIHAKRKGIIKRTIEIDGKKTEKEYNFTA